MGKTRKSNNQGSQELIKFIIYLIILVTIFYIYTIECTSHY